METKAEKVRVAEAEGRGKETRSRKETRREGVKEKEENNGGKESGKGIENMR